MNYEFSTVGALLGLVVAIILIIKKVQPAYSLIFGALIGGIIGSGGNLVTTVSAMVTGGESMISSVLRIMTSGILAGVLIKTGSAEKIAEVIVQKLGVKRALVSVSLATMVICAVGVFIDISVITVAPIALSIGRRAGYNRASLLLAMIGGGKAGNIISPNPNTIAVAEAFKVDLTSLMIRNLIPAVCAPIVTVLLASVLAGRKETEPAQQGQIEEEEKKLPSFLQAIAGPLVVIVLLGLRSVASVEVDPLIALPAGGIVCALACGHIRKIREYAEFGLEKVIGVSVLLIGTGTIAGIIQTSALQYDVIRLLEMANMPIFLLAPSAGILMAGAAASTTAGATIASQTFAGILTEAGVPALSAGAMVHAGATVIDSLPHGSFFHATGGAAGMKINERMKLIPFEACVGLTSTIASVILYLVF